MFSFAVFDSHGPAREWTLGNTYMLGPDNAPIQGDIRLTDGLVRCEKRTADAAALSVQFTLVRSGESEGGTAQLALQTCLLPKRQAPYLLSLELARHRIMLVINKLEEWALFDLPPDDPVMQLFDKARAAFTEAVAESSIVRTAAGFTMNAERLAVRALSLALEASEVLAERHAKTQQKRRVSGELAAAAARFKAPPNALTDHETRESRNAAIGSVGIILNSPAQVGCAAWQDQYSPAGHKVIQAGCDFMRIPMRWVDMEPVESRYAFIKTDRWIEWAVRTAKIPVVAGPVIEFRPSCIPEWLFIWEHDYETLREFVHEYVKQIVTRYRRTVTSWTIVSGLHLNTAFSLSLEQVIDLTRICVMLVRKLHPSATVQVGLDQPWGEACAANARSIPPLLYAELMAQASIAVDTFALRVLMGRPEQGCATRDLMAFSAMLDRYAALDRPLAISALGAPSGVGAPTGGAPRDPRLAPGTWRDAWTPETQAAWLRSAVAIAASKPYVQSICWDQLADGHPESALDGLIGLDGQPKPAAASLAQMRQLVKA